MRYTLLLLTLLLATPAFAGELNSASGPVQDAEDAWFSHRFEEFLSDVKGEPPVCVYYDRDTAQFIDPRSERGKEMGLLGATCHDDVEFYQ